MTIGDALMQGIALLREHSIEPPRLTAELLLGHALHCDKVYLLTHSGDPLPELAWIHYGRYLHERLGGKPLQYITGKQEFYRRDFSVEPGVLIPRPETEHLIEYVLALEKPLGLIVDAGVGSGAICVTLAAELRQTVFGLDMEATPLAVTRRNALRQQAAVELYQGSWLSALRPASVDVLVSNPPYIGLADKPSLQREVRDFEPARALFAGSDGLAAYREIASQAWDVVKPGGHLVLEIGSTEAAAFFSAWQDIQISPDLAGRPCRLTARR